MYSKDFKDFVIKKVKDSSWSLRTAEKFFEVSRSTISRWLNEVPKPRKDRIAISKKPEVIQLLTFLISENPFYTASQLQKHFQNSINLTVSRSLIQLMRSKIGFSRKKASYFTVSKNHDKLLQDFLEKRNRFLKENRYFVAIDETGFIPSPGTVYGYSKKGTRLQVFQKNRSRVRNTSSLALIDSEKLLKAELLHNHHYDSQTFYNFLVATSLPPKTVIILDNVAFHHSKKVKELALNRKWDLLYIPPYSPRFNPIEEVFATIKRVFRQTLSIHKGFQAVSKIHCKGAFRHALSQV